MVRCRMAPSPTGRLHIGTAHTALFNYLFARHHGGKFILRIDDSDPIRSKKEYEEDIINNLKWLGITWDEGPDIGGDYGPYRQSERLNTYQKYIDRLLTNGHGYRCFCSKEYLTEKRKAAELSQKPYIYDQTCLHLSSQDIQSRLTTGEKYVIRLKNPNKIVSFKDMVRGEISVDSTPMGDFILTRSDGSPLLNFAVTVDDIEFKITHAIRGEDFLNATPYQMLIYEALDEPPPEIANLSFIYAPDHSKLSKRHGATGVAEYKEMGYLPEAMVNFLAFLGWNPGDNRELYSMADLIREFDFDKVDKNAPTFNINKLNWFNGQYIRQKSNEELAKLLNADPKIVGLVKDRLVKLSDFPALTRFLSVAPQIDTSLFADPAHSAAHLNYALSNLNNLSNLDQIKSHGFKVGDFFMSLRIAVCGSKFTPPITDVITILGKGETIKRINFALEKLKISD